MSQYILSLDQGTTSSRAIIFNKKGEVIAVAQKEFTQIFPQSGWVEHDALEIWSSQASVAAEATVKAGINGKNIAAMGITNQRETVIVWDKNTGKPIYNAIVWQDRRTATFCDELKQAGKEELISSKTGLIIDAYFSATKIKWMLDNVPNARAEAEAGNLICGTVDTWLIWNFTKGELHVTDVTNASRTLLFNIHTMAWDDELLELFTIPKSMLPSVKQSSEVYGETKSTLFAHPIPIAGIAGDQQAALFGQMCTKTGMVKNTYGTGCFMLMNIGKTPKLSKNNLLTTVAWQVNGVTEYALEGSIFIAGAVVQWLRDGLGIIKTAADIEELALKVEDTGGVYFVPAFAGLGAPYWDSNARGTIVGLSRGTTASHIARAAIESIAYQTADVLKAMEADAGVKIQELRVDGGATANNILMQFQANLLNCKVIKPKVVETTALGAAYLAGLATGYWKDIAEIQQLWESDKEFNPVAQSVETEKGFAEWKRAVYATQSWSNS
ncbi:glycerol kinase GlpK [Pedobacter insulae]|uniref:Glycerol kinase n=1 Tax=Pedobacter insulae TaxID=414048 RepID=A0A1I2Y3Y5_9SPHI|nr:glycerol kinase GlpK [Pedobacter insulae]SFH20450.1 glycerol kinase [Pedobacter insulae]